MILHSVTLKDGTRYVNKIFADKDKDYNYTFTAEESQGKTSVFPGYANVHMDRPYPGMPILAYFFPVSEWETYQPSGFTLGNAFLKQLVAVRGTFSGYRFTAYHVGASAVFRSGSQFYETPNTPCMIETLSRHNIASTSVLTEPARYMGNNQFELSVDVAILNMFYEPIDKFLIFFGYQPRFIDAELVGVVSGSAGSMTIVAPLKPKPPERAYFTGSTSGTQILNCIDEVKEYNYAYKFGNDRFIVNFKRGWYCNGESRVGDSGAPVFVPIS